MSRLRGEPEVALDVDLDPQPLAVEPVLVALVLAEHRVEALVQVLVRAAPGVVDAHRVVGRDRPVEEAPVRPARVLRAQPGERPSLPPWREDLVLLGDESGFEVTGRNMRLRWRGVGEGGHRPIGLGGPLRRVRVSYPRCRTRRSARPRARSPFTAAFLSLLFPGLGHSMPARRCAPWRSPRRRSCSLALDRPGRASGWTGSSSSALSSTRSSSAASSCSTSWSLVYRLVAIVDAYRVAEFINAQPPRATGGSGPPGCRATRCRSPGLLAVCSSWPAPTSSSPATTPSRRTRSAAAASSSAEHDRRLRRRGRPSPGATASPATSPPSPTDSPTPEPTLDRHAGARGRRSPPWDGKERLNILLIGADEQGGGHNTDTLITVSIDPVTKQVAMFSLPRDTVDVPIPPGPARTRVGHDLRPEDQLVLRQQPEPLGPLARHATGPAATTRSSRSLGDLYGLDIKYFVEVNFDGFKKVVDALGGVTINVQVPVVDDTSRATTGTAAAVHPERHPAHGRRPGAPLRPVAPHARPTSTAAPASSACCCRSASRPTPQALIPRLPGARRRAQEGGQTDIPLDQIDKLLGLASQVDTANIRSYVFAPPLYQQRGPARLLHAAVRRRGSGAP